MNLIEFDQPGLDYANYKDIGKPNSYKVVVAALDADIWLQDMKSWWT